MEAVKLDFPFLQGGGEMGLLTRNFDWSKTSIGTPDLWPQTLRVTVSNLLRSKFPMFLWWGKDMLQFYNDAYRPSMGNSGKHPMALGQKGKECWPEIWDIISPLHEQVELTGEATWMENQLVPIYRNGQIEEVYWTFSYSSILDDAGHHAGILVTCMETTFAVLNQKKLELSQSRLHFALEAGHLGSWELDLKNQELQASAICKRIFGQPPGNPLSYETLKKSIYSEDLQRMEEEITRTINTGAEYNIEYRVIWPDLSIHWVNVRGQLYNEEGKPERLIGVSLDITDQKQAEKQLQESEAHFRSLIEEAPVSTCLLVGPEMKIEVVNEIMLGYWGKDKSVSGKPLAEALPELKGQPFLDILDRIYVTGETYEGKSEKAELIRDGMRGIYYFDYVYKPLRDRDGKIYGIMNMSVDVTEPVLARKKIEESEAKLKAVIHQAPATVSIGLFLGQELIIDTPNKAFIEAVGKGDHIEGRPLKEVMPELESQPFLQILDEVYTSRKPYESFGAPVNIVRNGEMCTSYYNVSFTPLFNEAGEVYAILDISFDVTDQIHAAQRLQESEVRFRTMAESTPVLIAVGDETSKITYLNKAWTEITGRPMEELLQIGWEAVIHQEDRERFVNLVMEAYALKEPFTDEFRIVNSTGEYRWLLAHGVARFDVDGNFAGYISACTDITEHKFVQQQLQTALEQVRLSKEAAELGTFDMDLEKGTMHWDDRCRVLFGISHHKKVTYEKDFIGGLHSDDRARIIEAVNHAYNKSISNGEYDVEYRTVGAEDSILRWVRAKGKVYFNIEEKPVRFVGSVLDITEQVNAIQKIEKQVAERTMELAQANEALQNINKELQRSNSNLEEFAHAASHDLKEPIRKIHFFTSQLKEQLSTLLKEDQARSFVRIEKATERMGNLIDDLLLYSHVSHRPHEWETIDLNQKVQNVLEDLELDIKEKAAIIHVGKLPVVQGYKRQLQQLFQNLISNALKYSKTDVVPQIEIIGRKVTDHDQTYHVVDVKDNGIGFEPQYADKIFQMFARLHGKNEYNGTGVGLSIVKKVVENHRGMIKVESEPGKGSTFSVFLPVNEMTESD